MISTSSFATLKLGPGAVDSINAAGQNFWVVFAPVPIQVMYPGTEWGFFEQGTGLDNLPGDQSFPRLTVRNPSLGAITIVIYVGGPLYRDSRLSVMSTRTRLAGWNLETMAGNAHLDLDGITPLTAPPAGVIDLQRAHILITNNDPAQWLELVDVAGHVCGRVLATKQILLPVSDFVRIQNPVAAGISCEIAEVWNCVGI